MILVTVYVCKQIEFDPITPKKGVIGMDNQYKWKHDHDQPEIINGIAPTVQPKFS